MSNPNTYTVPLTEAQARALEARLRQAGYVFRAVPYARFAAERESVKIVMYASGKLVVQGTGTGEFVEFLLEPEILKQAVRGYEAVLNPRSIEPRLGVDESGKGDFFGPLCVAGVYVNAEILKAWQDLGIRDSKSIGSSSRIAELARAIRSTRGCVHQEVVIGNAAYNRLYARLRNVNTLLAWGHARVIENLLGQRHRMTPAPMRVVVDQFAASERTVNQALMAAGRQIALEQRHRAEEDTAVAAASILARAEFLSRLRDLGRAYELELPRGAGAPVDEAAREFCRKHGAGALAKVAKLHFKNARSLNLPA